MPAIAAYQADNSDGADPAHDEQWGTTSGSWYLHKSQTGFRVIGQGGYGLCNVQTDKDLSGTGTEQKFVYITSITTTAGRYPAVLTVYDAGASTWSDDGDTIWVVDPDGEDLGLHKHGAAWLVGTVDGVDVYMGSANLWDDGDCAS